MKLSNKIFQFPALLFALAVISSCSKDPEIQYTSTYKMSGEWFTQYFDNGAPVTGFGKILTYNTSDPNSNQVWVDDHANATAKYRFRSKFNVDYTNLSFLAMPAATNDVTAGRTVKVYEGKVIPKGGHSKTNVLVDSIYLKIELSNDPGKIYEIKGHARTGFFEDEY
jgi:hypothetical protein